MWYDFMGLCATDMGLVSDPKLYGSTTLNTTIRTGVGDQSAIWGGGELQMINNFRTIYLGAWTDLTSPPTAGWWTPNDAMTNAIPPAGSLVQAPIGLGYLLQCGYLGDARVYFCPSSADSMPGDSDYYGGFYSGVSWGGFQPTIHTQSQLRSMGGFDANALSHGDCTWLPSYGGHKFWYSCPGEFLVTQSNYNYRDVPCLVGFSEYTHFPVMSGVYMLDTKPRVEATAGCPPFKTQKILGNRSLVSDSFSQQGNLGIPVFLGFGPVAGMGQYAHRDGYNVLYGDWSARWYGDPQQRIMWYNPNRIHPPYTWDDTYMRSSAVNGLTVWLSADAPYSDPSYAHYYMGSQNIWHIFDTSNGMDSDVTDTNW
jgi:hypothetical protein